MPGMETEAFVDNYRFLARYNETGSLRPGEYADVTRNASYFVGMLLHESR